MPQFATPFGILGMGVINPICFTFIRLFLKKSKPDNLHILFCELSEKGLSALELQKISNEYGIDKYIMDYVIKKRFEELGLKVVPEVCVRDGIMPTEDMAKEILNRHE